MIGLLLIALSLPLPATRGQAAVVDRAGGSLLGVSPAKPAEYAIGSTIKPFTLLAAYRAGVLSAATRIACRRGTGRYRCSHQPLGSVSPAQAIEFSCNWFVLAVGRRTPPAIFRETLAAFGLRPPPGAALSDDDLLGATTRATPEQLARAYQRWLSSDAPEFLKHGVAGGKTGTSGRHAWYVCHTARYVLAVMVFSGTGARDARPMGAQLLASMYRIEYRGKLIDVDEDNYTAMALAGEAGDDRSPEYLRALGVLFRTFARKERGRHAGQGYDFCDSTHCLALRPQAGVFSVAVESSRHRTMTFAGRTAQVFFSANCGGKTEPVEELWPKAAVPYLAGHADEYCRPRTWQSPLTLEGVHEIRVVRRTASGRAAELLVDGKVARAQDFRLQLGRTVGWASLKSLWFDVQRQGDRFVFEGRGVGHGVGLCQAGAAEMAHRRHSYREILAYYYPGTDISVDWPALAGEFSLNGRAPEIVEHPTVESFIRATGRAGWTAAAVKGGRIHLQPAALLEKSGILETTLRHELVHAAVARPVPRWLDEGAAIYLSGEGPRYPTPVTLPEAELERRLRAPAAREKLRAAYAACYWRVRRLVAREGEAALLSRLGIR